MQSLKANSSDDCFWIYSLWAYIKSESRGSQNDIGERTWSSKNNSEQREGILEIVSIIPGRTWLMSQYWHYFRKRIHIRTSKSLRSPPPKRWDGCPAVVAIWTTCIASIACSNGMNRSWENYSIPKINWEIARLITIATAFNKFGKCI